MSYTYVLTDPARKLRELAVGWATTLQRFDREPNCRVAFARDSESSPEPTTAGWLLDSSEVPGRRNRYLLLPDGTVWHELVLEPPLAPKPSVAVREWVDKPSHELVTLLGHSVTRVQYGLTDERIDAKADPVVVGDRRRVWRAHPASERRAQA
jgi:hypothetical protein